MLFEVQSYLQRVIAKADDLKLALEKLVAFMETSGFKCLPSKERARLAVQRHRMEKRLEMLTARIHDLPT